MILTRFCPVCGAANEPEHTHCFACGQILTTGSESAGALLHDRYQLGLLLGSGGFSCVYHARDTRAGGRDVAIKQIQLQGLSAEEVIEATNTFNREVALLSSLHHPQIPQLYEHFHDQDHWYLVLEYLEGTTLEAYLETRATQGRAIPVDEALSIALQLCVVLEYLHTRQPPVIFRDLKPGNIMRTPSGKLCLIDFGIARQYRPGQARDTQRLGSPGYAAPEQYGRTQTTPQADIYSLGALLHALLSGQDPATHPRALAPLRLGDSAAEADLAMLVQRMLADDPAARPARARDIAAALEQARQALRASHENGRIWIPPQPQELPPTMSDGQHQLQVLLPAAPVQRPLPAVGPRLKRRRVLAGIGVLAVAVVSGEAIWQALKPAPGPVPQPSPINLLYTYQGHTDAVWNAIWSPNTLRVVSCSLDKTVQIWDALNGRHAFIYRGHTGELMDATWSPDGTQIASASADKTVQVWDAHDGNRAVLYQGHTNTVMEANWSPNGALIASCSLDNTAQVWTAADGKQLLTYRGHLGEVYSVKWSPDGRHIASASEDNTAHIWDAATMQTLSVYRGHQEAVYEVVWSPDGKRLASASKDRTVHVWNETDGGDTLIYRGHSQAVNNLAWSPDGTRIASVSDDTTVQVWTVTDGNTLFTYTGHTQPVTGASWSPSGTLIASASEDTTVQVWQAP